MRILGLDVGTKTIGVAVSDPMGWTAQAITTVRRKSLEYDLECLAKVVKDYEVETILIGLPRHMNGTYGASVEMVQSLGEVLKVKFNLPIIYQDERLSTVAANRVLLEGDVSRAKRKQVIDQMAAAYILQGYLDGLAK